MSETEIHLMDMVQMTIEGDQPAWALLSVSPDKYQDYKLAVERGESLDINQYGDVLAYKIGAEEPTLEEAQELHEKFGYLPDLNIEEKIESLLQSRED